MHTDRTLSVLAWCNVREGFRTFRADRLVDLVATGTSFRQHRVTLLRECLAQLQSRKDHSAA